MKEASTDPDDESANGAKDDYEDDEAEEKPKSKKGRHAAAPKKKVSGCNKKRPVMAWLTQNFHTGLPSPNRPWIVVMRLKMATNRGRNPK